MTTPPENRFGSPRATAPQRPPPLHCRQQGFRKRRLERLEQRSRAPQPRSCPNQPCRHVSSRFVAPATPSAAPSASRPAAPPAFRRMPTRRAHPSFPLRRVFVPKLSATAIKTTGQSVESTTTPTCVSQTVVQTPKRIPMSETQQQRFIKLQQQFVGLQKRLKDNNRLHRLHSKNK